MARDRLWINQLVLFAIVSTTVSPSWLLRLVDFKIFFLYRCCVLRTFLLTPVYGLSSIEKSEHNMLQDSIATPNLEVCISFLPSQQNIHTSTKIDRKPF